MLGRGSENAGCPCPEHLLNTKLCSKCPTPPTPGVTREGRCHSSRHRVAGFVTRAVCGLRFALGEQNRNRGLLLTLRWVGNCSTGENTLGQPGRLPTGSRFDRREGHI